MENSKLKVVMLCVNGQSSRIMYHGLAHHVVFERIILENKPSLMHMIGRRVRKLGILKVSGQLLFLVFNKIFYRISRVRIDQLICDYKLNDTSFPNDIVNKLDSINSKETICLLKNLKPDAVVVNGTRILSKDVLLSIDAPFINTHMGITLRYRGVHGGYWALVSGDSGNCGVTVHLVDHGIDTGGVLYQDTISVDCSDNFNTYPIHQIAKAIPLMKAALNDVRKKQLSIRQGALPSRLWYHPTLLEYLKHYMRNGVK